MSIKSFLTAPTLGDALGIDMDARRAKQKFVVKTYKGDGALQHGLRQMAKKGWVPQNQASRKQVYSLATGFFTRKQIHTVTFIREEKTRDGATDPR